MTPTPFHALELACSRAGGQSALARRLGVSQTTVWKWLQKGQMSAERGLVLIVEKHTGVSRHWLRPDIYPPETYPVEQEAIFPVAMQQVGQSVTRTKRRVPDRDTSVTTPYRAVRA